MLVKGNWRDFWGTKQSFLLSEHHNFHMHSQYLISMTKLIIPQNVIFLNSVVKFASCCCERWSWHSTNYVCSANFACWSNDNANKNFQALFEIIPRWQCLTGKEFVKSDHSELYTQVSPWGDGNKETAELKFLQLLYSRTKCLSIQTYLSPKHE